MTTPAVRAMLRREMAVSAGINAVLSVAFFLLVFGRPERLAFWEPDRLALDFLPQFAAVTLMSALVPAFLSRRKLAAASGGRVAPGRDIVLRAGALCLGGLGLAGAAIALVRAGGWTTIDGTLALALKTLAGAAVGALAAKLALRPLAAHPSGE